MKSFIKKILFVLMVISTFSGQVVFAKDDDLSSYIYNHLENWDTEFDFSYNKSDVLDYVRSIAQKDDYLDRSLESLVYERRGLTGTLKVTYKTTKTQEEYISEELKKIISTTITDSMSDFDKVKAINKYLIDRFEYDDSLVSDNSYSALTTGKTTCQGYAMTTYKLLNLVGIENKIVLGTLDGVPHGWNLVKLNGKWYHLDVTNNDAVGNDKYFLRKDSILVADGFSWENNKYPKCDEDYDFGNSNNGIGQSTIGYKSNVDGNWTLNNGKWYFYKKTRTYAKSWNIIDGKWYFFSNNGDMETGWISFGGKWYYCYPDSGAMAVNTVVNGYTVDGSGAWVA
ncbi:hypothetical protein B0P06_003766 [Clostridium saccharoperbutylacetonicum]|uniref:Transglutaminase-like superfamily/putative cell wall binding repeat protein n=1 Tax=Clostridium saccharoperbutylacetonicum N1-4(HMT) TaxID=931276 RepID=M1MJ16_9CLOT|nr:transglutaminase domain-containing protein [Clostridium saccharoperbutylacetonicum]AGF57924.1 transglutaminase-like superfamily/putative cell wall binding repeat protein [Clostridium saccharoperbutylacetonicum N1-4(HMT)]NRT61303.1 hypothetical protein [Clostridium saccharoperbutylacetonicum]NSB24620.1 hypothetical protein [Clostridium saccharoperbutylacetonicum]NSB43995.1 hypothetical protein [Clostridium saccharoperbutylacetonicum]